MFDGPESRPLILLQFLDLLVWVRERPHDYCKTVGELEELLESLYDICAEADGQGLLLAEVAVEALLSRGLIDLEDLLNDEERGLSISDGGLAIQKLIGFWTELDTSLAFPSPKQCCEACAQRADSYLAIPPNVQDGN